jgi:hypothetical protein
LPYHELSQYLHREANSNDYDFSLLSQYAQTVFRSIPIRDELQTPVYSAAHLYPTMFIPDEVTAARRPYFDRHGAALDASTCANANYS